MDSDGSTDESFVLPDLASVVHLTVEQALRETGSNPSKFSISAEAYGKYNKKSSFQPNFVPKDNEV
jgi:hypothetical protein